MGWVACHLNEYLIEINTDFFFFIPMKTRLFFKNDTNIEIMAEKLEILG